MYTTLMTTKPTRPTHDADGVYTGAAPARTPAEQTEHDAKVAAYKAEVAAREATQSPAYQAWKARNSRLTDTPSRCRDCGANGAVDYRGLGISCGCAAE